jgi:hypothetical protein
LYGVGHIFRSFVNVDFIDIIVFLYPVFCTYLVIAVNAPPAIKAAPHQAKATAD